jgi:DNA-binding protein H-NS
MGKLHLEAMEFDELWRLHEQLTTVLSERIIAEKIELEKRLAQLKPEEGASVATAKRPRRKYPKVMPKYYNPLVPTETWSGRGRQPRWLVAALRSGQKLESFLITGTADVSDDNPQQSPRRR